MCFVDLDYMSLLIRRWYAGKCLLLVVLSFVVWLYDKRQKTLFKAVNLFSLKNFILHVLQGSDTTRNVKNVHENEHKNVHENVSVCISGLKLLFFWKILFTY